MAKMAQGKHIRLADIEATFRRSGPMMQNPQAVQTSQQWHEMQQKSREQAEMTKRRSEKPVDRNIPEGIDDLVLGDGVRQYEQLRDMERRLDATMMRKRLDVQDSTVSSTPQYGTLRIWISNTTENQPWQQGEVSHDTFDFNSGAEATYRVKIEGRLLDVDGNPEDAEPALDGDTSRPGTANEESRVGDGEPAAKRAKLSKTYSGRRKLSHFFKSINVDFDRSQNLQPDGFTAIEWKNPETMPRSFESLPLEADFDCLEFERKGDEKINVTVTLVRDSQPERYKLARPLAELLDIDEADQKTILIGLWEYIKQAGLQEEGDSRRIRCDDRLKNVFGRDLFQFENLPNLIRKHVFDLPPITLQYTIRLDQEYQETNHPPTIYDIPVPLPDPMYARLHSVISSPSHASTLRQIALLDDRVAMKVQEMAHYKAKHAFFTGMAEDPANFTKRWISSQKRDLDVILGAGAYGDEDWQGPEWRQGGERGPWGSNEAVEGVSGFLSKYDAPRPAAPPRMS
ncbi:MAG: SWI/SNF complex component snf12 [Chrysothrix sp. TS-e1954]|nr:MAG: SWI/SNF complex component snf12 [Chrysothrix sp. TS-e1954]